MSTPERDESVAEALGALARSAAEQTQADDSAARAMLLKRAAEADISPPRATRKWLALVPALVVAALLVVWWNPGSLHYDVTGAAQNGSYVSASPQKPATVRFSDDTVVEVASGSQLRIEDTSRRGARVLLERGGANVHVVHRSESRWTFVAGPFEVLVTGTRFDLAWDPAHEVFEVRLREGSVEIQTPLSTSPVALRAGQHFKADLTKRSMTTTEGAQAQRAPSPAASQAPAAESAPEKPSEALADARPTPSAVGSSSAAVRSWQKLVAAGQFDAVLTQAGERGIPSCVRSCSASDLSALADAARYKGRSDVADQSLRALRSRFAKDLEGRNAAFLLGRLQEGRGATGDARTWYERYLSESPGGAYAAEALAGKMSTTQKLEGQAAAAPIARQYLERYPNGVHSKLARSILGTH